MASTPQEPSNLKRELDNGEDSNSPNKKSKTEARPENQNSLESDFNGLPEKQMEHHQQQHQLIPLMYRIQRIVIMIRPN